MDSSVDGGSQDAGEEPECTIDDDCGPDLVCLEQECRPPPIYLLLFTHTEDHINHDLSEERFWRFFPVIADLAARYPEVDVSWTVQFMGADTETIAERNPETGLVDFIRGFADNPAVSFGYHGMHEPTYTNNSLANLGCMDMSCVGTTWEEILEASLDFLTLGKDPTRGDVDPARAGGLELVQDTFGPARIISGYGKDQAQIHAADSMSSGYVMFGFPDHGPEAQPQAVRSLMTRLCPERRTPGGIFWMDGKLHINDGNPMEGVGLMSVELPQEALDSSLDRMDLTKVQVMNVHIATKFIYADESPTRYAYNNPDDPELPPGLLLSEADREQKYQWGFDNLEYLAGTYLPAHSGSRFVSGTSLLELFVNEIGAEIPLTRVLAIATALADGYINGAPPDFVKAQGYYYTLAEAWSLVLQALAAHRESGALPAAVVLHVPHGPIEDAPASAGAATLDSAAIADVASSIAALLPPGEWTAVPRDMIPAQVTVGTTTLNAAELLRAAADLLIQIGAGQEPASITVEPADLLPDIHDAFRAIREPVFPGVSWSLKPARHR